MDDTALKLSQMIRLVDDIDQFGGLSKDMSVFSVAIGTLRKDKSLVADILNIIGEGSDGLGAIALTRILCEDYLHLAFLNADRANLKENVENFNKHPHIGHYAAIHAMQEWGIDLGDKESQYVVEADTKAFEENKNRFLRPSKSASLEFDADDYWRTWTKLGMKELIVATHMVDTEKGKKSLKFITEMYDISSEVIHHNSFVIWLLANQEAKIFSDKYPSLASTVALIVFSYMIKLVIEVSESVVSEEQRAQFMSRLADIM